MSQCQSIEMVTERTKISIQVKQLLLALLIISLNNTADASSTYYLVPRQCHNCHTLNEVIENGISFYDGSGIKVVLLPGLHVINSTKNTFMIESIGSLTLTGQGQAVVKCLHEFSFNFSEIEDVTVSGIRFESCSALTNFDQRDVVILRSTKLRSTFLLMNVRNISIENLIIKDGGLAVVPKYVTDIKFRFQGINISSGQLGIYVTKQGRFGVPDGNLLIDVYDSVFKNAFVDVITTRADIYQLEMRRVSFYDKVKSSYPVVYVVNVRRVHLNTVNFQNNSSPLLEMIGIDLTVIMGYCSFKFNFGKGGALIRTTNFTLYPHTTFEMTYNNVKKSLLCIPFLRNKTSTISVWFNAKMNIQNNTIKSGAIVEMSDANSIKIVQSSLTFKNNHGLTKQSTAILLLKDIKELAVSESSLVFSYNKATLSGGITFENTRMIVYSFVRAEFRNNEGGNGGAMAFYQKSVIFMLRKYSSRYVTVGFHHNKALKQGGAIFVEDSDYMNIFTGAIKTFFINLPQEEISSSLQFLFSNNSAEIAGDDVYGGWIDLCKFYLIMLSNSTFNPVTSNPIRVCMCLNSVPTCVMDDYRMRLFPGQTFEIEAVAVGQRMGIVPSIVLAQLIDEEGSLGAGQDVQSVGRECSKLQFTIYTMKQSKQLVLKTQERGVPKLTGSQLRLLKSDYLSQQLSILIEVKNCKAGFEFHTILKKCICSKLITQHEGVGCNLNTFTIQRIEGRWLFVTEDQRSTNNSGIIIHDNCPYDYCRTDADSLTFQLETPDDQCAFNRSRVLCGACQANLSQVLGTSRCRECSGAMIFVVIPAIVIAGFLLVVLLMILNLTVSTGTFNGLIFYVNIIRASQAVFFPPEISNSFLSIFTAWLNLDLGIETCFYNGLDAYAKTWLQFVFPLYIWLMVITIIVASHYSSTVSKLFGNNAVQVLATLLLLSYAKILRVVITVFSYTVLIYPDGYEKKVWLLDGNIEFLRGKHIPLFVASLLMIIFLSVPYTLSLVSIQMLQRMSHYRVLFWVHRLMPLFDAYTGPYKHKHRYWTGLLLLARVLFILIFSLNISNNPAVNLLAIAVISSTIFGYLCFMRVYKKLFHTILEALSIFNLGQLSVATLYQISNEGSSLRIILTNISTSIAFIIFIYITFYHAIQRLLSLKKVKYIISQLKEHTYNGEREKESAKNQEINFSTINSEITHTSVKLSEPLLSEETSST